MKVLHTMLLITGLLAGFIANAQSRPLITVGYYEFPPASYTNSSNKPAGDIIELGRNLLTEAGYDVVFNTSLYSSSAILLIPTPLSPTYFSI